MDLNAEFDRVLRWAHVADAPVGKQRFQLTRAALAEWLRDVAKAPASSKKFLSEKLLQAVGKSGTASSLPAGLQQILGTSAEAFAQEVRTGYQIMSGKAPIAEMKEAVNSVVSALEATGQMTSEQAAAFKKVSMDKLFRKGGGYKLIEPLVLNLRNDPAAMEALSNVGTATKVTGSAATKTAGTGFFSKLGQYAAKMGKLGKVGKALAPVGPIGAGLAGVGLASSAYEHHQNKKTAKEMLRTGIIPDKYGGNATLPVGPEGQPMTASDFMLMMRQREQAMAASRFAMQMKNADLAQQVFSYAAGNEDVEDVRALNRIRLGSLRSAPREQASIEEAMTRYNQVVREAAIP